MPTDVQRLPKALGRHTRLVLPFSWRDAGAPVDLTDYTARAWVRTPDGITHGPFACTIEGTEARYTLRVEDLAQASIEQPETHVRITVVAQHATGVPTLTSFPPREIVVGDWAGADDYSPV